MGEALRGAVQIYGTRLAVGRQGIAHTQLCRVSQPEDLSTLILPRPRTYHPWQMRISQGLERGWKAKEFMDCACSDSAAVVSGKERNWFEARLAQFLAGSFSQATVYICPTAPTAPRNPALSTLCFSLRLLLNSPVMATVDMNFVQIYRPPLNPPCRWKKQIASYSDGRSVRGVSSLSQVALPRNKLGQILESSSQFKPGIAATRDRMHSKEVTQSELKVRSE